MINKIKSLVLLLGVSVNFISFAQEPEAKTCELDGDQHQLNMCSGERREQADMEMNTLYKEQIKYLRTAPKKRLRDSQRSWIIYRDKTCHYESGPREESGSIWPMENNLCLEKLTKQRIEILKSYIECRANGCPY